MIMVSNSIVNKSVQSNTEHIGHKDQDVELLTLELEGVPRDADAKQIK